MAYKKKNQKRQFKESDSYYQLENQLLSKHDIF